MPLVNTGPKLLIESTNKLQRGKYRIPKQNVAHLKYQYIKGNVTCSTNYSYNEFRIITKT